MIGDWGQYFPDIFSRRKKIFPRWNSLITGLGGGGRRTPAPLWAKLCSPFPPNLGIFAPRTDTNKFSICQLTMRSGDKEALKLSPSLAATKLELLGQIWQIRLSLLTLFHSSQFRPPMHCNVKPVDTWLRQCGNRNSLDFCLLDVFKSLGVLSGLRVSSWCMFLLCVQGLGGEGGGSWHVLHPTKEGQFPNFFWKNSYFLRRALVRGLRNSWWNWNRCLSFLTAAFLPVKTGH